LESIPKCGLVTENESFEKKALVNVCQGGAVTKPASNALSFLRGLADKGFYRNYAKGKPGFLYPGKTRGTARRSTTTHTLGHTPQL
jgi:hypothetical protein